MLNFPATVPRHLLSKNRRTSENEAQTKHPLKVHVWAGISRHCAKTGKNKRTAPLGATISNKSHDQRSAAHFNFTILLNTRAVCTWREVRTFELHTCGCVFVMLYSVENFMRNLMRQAQSENEKKRSKVPTQKKTKSHRPIYYSCAAPRVIKQA